MTWNISKSAECAAASYLKASVSFNTTRLFTPPQPPLPPPLLRAPPGLERFSQEQTAA